MCGLRRRAEYPDFIDLVNSYDLICFSESKIDKFDVISFPGYGSFDQPRKQKYRRKSGGISVYFKEKVLKHLKKIDTDSDYILWFELDKELVQMDEKIIFGTVYIPPERSNFFNDDEMALLESEITSFCSSNKYVFITGDFNSRTSELRDFTENDEFLADMFDFDTETVEFFSHINKLENFSIPRNRKSMDKHTNNNGFKLLDICKNNNLFILNGRLDNDMDVGKFSFRNTSVIDYIL